MTVELTDEEVKMICEALRLQEHNSRSGFANTIAQKAGKEDLTDKIANFTRVINLMMGIRLKLGEKR